MRKILAGALIIAALVVAGCAKGGDHPAGDAPPAYDPNPAVLNIVMGSEQRLIFDQVVHPWCESNGLTCTAKELGSVDQANALGDDCAHPPAYDVFWFASTVFEQIGNEHCGALVDSRPTFSSPVVFAERPTIDRPADWRNLALLTALAAMVAAKLPVPEPVTSPVRVMVWSPVLVPLLVPVMSLVRAIVPVALGAVSVRLAVSEPGRNVTE